jgi:hypothetical protein
MKPRAVREQVWRDLAHLLEEEEGVLAEVRFVDPPLGSSADIFEMLRGLAEPLEPHRRSGARSSRAKCR